MKRIVFGLVLTFAFAALFTAPASAGALVMFERCSIDCVSTFGMRINLDARNDGTGLPGGPVEVEFMSPILYGQNALEFNIAGSHAGLTISNLTPGFTVGGTNEAIGPFGTFEFLINGPPTWAEGGPCCRPLSFTISRDGGFFDDMSVFEMNAAGYFAGGNAFDFFTPSTKYSDRRR